MGKIFGILILIICGILLGFVFNLIIDLIVLGFKKLSKKIRLAMGVPYKDEAPKDVESSSDEEPKHDTNAMLQKILAKRQNSSDDESPKNDDKGVTDDEAKE